MKTIVGFLLRPVDIITNYQLRYLRADLVAGLTVAVIALPQAMAYALIAELPAQFGLYAAIVGAIVGALWGSSHQLQTGPTNTTSLLALATLLSVAAPGTPEYLAAAGLMAVMIGIFRLAMGLAQLGMIVNFVSDAVVVGFTAGAGVLIAINQLRHLFRLPIPSAPELWQTIPLLVAYMPELHWPSLAIGLGTVCLILALRRVNRHLPAPLFGMIAAGAAVALLGWDVRGVETVGQLPQSLPPFRALPIFDLELISRLFSGSLAVAAIGLVEAMSIARSIASQTDQRLDNNQEFVGQGLANIASGFFSGYTCSGSFTRSAVNFEAGAKTPLSSVFGALFVLITMLVLAPLAAYVPLPALAGVLILTAYNLIDYREARRIWRSAHADRGIMIATTSATLALPLQVAVLTGIALSIISYLLETSKPRVRTVGLSEDFRYFTPRSERPACTQLGVIEILGDLYFGAVNHIEAFVQHHLENHPTQRFLLLRMYSVENCDISGIHTLESIVESYRDRGGDVYFVHVHEPVFALMRSSGFVDYVGDDHFLEPDQAVSYLFHHVLDPAICIYECPVRAFEECQNLPKQLYAEGVDWGNGGPVDVPTIDPVPLWEALHSADPPEVIDVREPREFQSGHIPGAKLRSLPDLLDSDEPVSRHRETVLVDRGGRRSNRATAELRARGYENVQALDGGMLAWERENLLEAKEYG